MEFRNLYVRNPQLSVQTCCLHLHLLRENSQKHTPEGHVRNKGCQDILYYSGSCDQVEGLEDHTYLSSELPQFLSLEASHIGSINGKSAICDVMHSVDGSDKSGFSGSRETDDAYKLSLFDGKGNIG